MFGRKAKKLNIELTAALRVARCVVASHTVNERAGPLGNSVMAPRYPHELKQIDEALAKVEKKNAR